jgi:polar amino acid transport system substrate-binding protein
MAGGGPTYSRRSSSPRSGSIFERIHTVYLNRLRIAVLAAVAGACVIPVAASAQACTSAIPNSELVSPGKLMLSTNPTLRPLQYVDMNGEIKGMNVDLANELAKRLCLKLELIKMDFPAMIPALKSGRFDGMNTGMFYSDERAKILWAVPYALSAIDVVGLPTTKVTLSGADKLAGLKVGIEADTYQEKWLRTVDKENQTKGLKPMAISAFPTASDVMAALRAGQLEVAAFPNYAGGSFVKQGLAKMLLPGQGGTATMMAFRTRPVADAVVTAFNAMIKDGTYDRILDEYGMTKLPERVIAIRGEGPK